MNTTQQPDYTQAALWNGPAGHAWVDTQEVLDRLFQPFADALVDAVRSTHAGRVLDVGCGTGATTLALARAVGARGRCTGIDISEPMIAAARARGEREGSTADFLCSDAQSYPFEPATFDAIVSRFGVMFFDDPVRAFANLRRAAVPGAALHIQAWRSVEENSFMTVAERAAAPYLPNLPARRPDAPGQFAFADPARVRAILEPGGWTGIDIQPFDVPCVLSEEDVFRYMGRMGPVGQSLQNLDEATRPRVLQAVRSAFQPYIESGKVRFTCACWTIVATA